jgi:transposase
VAEASQLLGLSERQIIRLRKDVSEKGKDAVKHGNTDKPPSNKTDENTKEKIVELYKTKYHGANFQHFTELLEEKETISVGVTTVKRLLKAEDVQSPKSKRKPKPHIRRKRRAHEGALAQTDATPYEFFGTLEKVCLHGILDDATGKVLGLYMTRNECLEGYFAIFEQMIANFGIPASIYADRHTIFSSPKAERITLEDELAGIQIKDTQLGRACRELGITLIKARSPQAKGRIERLWSTLQDRLTIELRIKGIADIDAANLFLPSYIPKFNERFAVEAAETVSLFMPNTLDLVSILCVREPRKLDNGGAFSFYGQCFVVNGDIRARASIEVIAHRKQGIFALYNGQRYTVERIDKPKRQKKVEPPLVAPRKPYIPPDSHYHKRGKETYISYSSEYTDTEIMAMLDEIFLKSIK